MAAIPFQALKAIMTDLICLTRQKLLTSRAASRRELLVVTAPRGLDQPASSSGGAVEATAAAVAQLRQCVHHRQLGRLPTDSLATEAQGAGRVRLFLPSI